MYKSIILILFMLFSVAGNSQSDSLMVKNDKSTIIQKKFDSKKLNEYKKDKEFIYVEEIENKEPLFIERVYNWLVRQFLRFLEWIFGVKYAKGVFGGILKAFPYIIVGLLFFFLLKFFLKVNTNSIVSNSSNKSVVSITEEESLIKNTDLINLIQLAINNNNYRLAIRYYYLNILKKLEGKELILWEQQKTNEDYIKEISKENIKEAFKDLTRLYDFVWYGNFDINELEFTRVEAAFIKTENLIRKG